MFEFYRKELLWISRRARGGAAFPPRPEGRGLHAATSMTERPAHPPAPFPGATGLSVLDVYDWVAPDGLRGGSAHVHLVSTEGYLVLSGAGELQTLSARGYAASPLR